MMLTKIERLALAAKFDIVAQKFESIDTNHRYKYCPHTIQCKLNEYILVGNHKVFADIFFSAVAKESHISRDSASYNHYDGSNSLAVFLGFSKPLTEPHILLTEWLKDNSVYWGNNKGEFLFKWPHEVAFGLPLDTKFYPPQIAAHYRNVAKNLRRPMWQHKLNMLIERIWKKIC